MRASNKDVSWFPEFGTKQPFTIKSAETVKNPKSGNGEMTKLQLIFPIGNGRTALVYANVGQWKNNDQTNAFLEAIGKADEEYIDDTDLNGLTGFAVCKRGEFNGKEKAEIETFVPLDEDLAAELEAIFKQEDDEVDAPPFAPDEEDAF